MALRKRERKRESSFDLSPFHYTWRKPNARALLFLNPCSNSCSLRIGNGKPRWGWKSFAYEGTQEGFSAARKYKIALSTFCTWSRTKYGWLSWYVTVRRQGLLNLVKQSKRHFMEESSSFFLWHDLWQLLKAAMYIAIAMCFCEYKTKQKKFGPTSYLASKRNTNSCCSKGKTNDGTCILWRLKKAAFHVVMQMMTASKPQPWTEESETFFRIKTW